MDTPEGIQLGLLAWLCLPLLSTLAATACAVFPELSHDNYFFVLLRHVGFIVLRMKGC